MLGRVGVQNVPHAAQKIKNNTRMLGLNPHQPDQRVRHEKKRVDA
jgi:hypothetical protein